MVLGRRILAFALLVVVAGCGGSGGRAGTGGTGGSGGSGTSVPAKRWMGDVCTALDDWQKPKVPDTADNANLPEVKTVVVHFLDSLSQATDTIVRKVGEAGVPDVENGATAAGDFKQALRRMATSVKGARTKIEAIDDKDPSTFPAGLTQLSQTLTTDVVGSVQATVSAFGDVLKKYPALAEAAKDVPECSRTG